MTVAPMCRSRRSRIAADSRSPAGRADCRAGETRPGRPRRRRWRRPSPTMAEGEARRAGAHDLGANSGPNVAESGSLVEAIRTPRGGDESRVVERDSSSRVVSRRRRRRCLPCRRSWVRIPSAALYRTYASLATGMSCRSEPVISHASGSSSGSRAEFGVRVYRSPLVLAQSDSESASTETLAPAKAAWSARPPTMSFRLAIGH